MSLDLAVMQAAPTPNEVEATARTIAGALAGCDETDLLARARRGLRSPDVARGHVHEQLPTAVALALLRPLRLMALAGASAPLVADVSFVHIDLVASACATLVTGPSGCSLRRWMADSGLGAWCVDQAAWQAGLANARRRRRTLSLEEVGTVACGRTVAAVWITELRGGALDGAGAVRVVLDDASVLMLPAQEPTVARRSLLVKDGVLTAWSAGPGSAVSGAVTWQPSLLAAAA